MTKRKDRKRYLSSRTQYLSSSRVPVHTCPSCHRVMDATTTVSDTPGKKITPSPGDITICAYCRTVCIFLIDNVLRPATTEECEKYLPEWARAFIEEQGPKTTS